MSATRKQEEREAIRNAEKSHVIIPNMHYKDSPPQFVAIMGPPASGKSSIFGDLTEVYTGRRFSSCGLVTLSLRHKRVTLYEAESTLSEMIDVLKVADVAVFCVNAESGLERETLEGISVIQSHGTVKIIVVFTHLKTKKGSKSGCEKIRKIIEKEVGVSIDFYDAISDGATKICRCIELTKTRPVVWKCTHPHIVVDVKRKDYFYGYVRGGPLGNKTDVHVPGYGDYVLTELESENDPCPLKDKRKRFHAPLADFDESNETEDKKEEGGCLFKEKSVVVKLFGGDGESESQLSSHEETPEIESDDEEVAKRSEGKEQKDEEKTLTNRVDVIEKIKSRFKRKSEQDVLQRVEENIRKAKTHTKNFLQEQKEREQRRIEEVEKATQYLIPGTYCRFKLEGEGIDYNGGLMIVGSYLITEKTHVHLEGKILKNKRQIKDLKTNTPYFVSLGWWRFQTVPIFSKEGKAIKYLRSVTGARTCETVFYGPSVAVGTGFCMFSNDAAFRILSSGSVTNSVEGTVIKKKLKLVGFPEKIMGNNAIIQSMFSSDKEVDSFLNAKIKCASGLRGIIKSPIGRGGHFRATFEGPMLVSDVVFLRCFVPLTPRSYIKHISRNQSYLLPEKPEDCNKNEASSSLESNSEEGAEGFSGEEASLPEDVKADRLRKEIKKLEKSLPFDPSRITERCDVIDLPVPPEKRKEEEERKWLILKRSIKEAQRQKEELCKSKEREKKRQLETEEKANRRRKLALESKAKNKRHR